MRRVVEHERPDDITVAFDDGMRAAETVRLFGIKRRVDAAEDHRRTSRPRDHADFVAAKRVAGVNADADDVARLHAAQIEGLEGFVCDLRATKRRRSRPGEDEQPPRGDHANAE